MTITRGGCLGLCVLLAAAVPAAGQVPANMVEVKPVPATGSGSHARSLKISQGRHFAYALPDGWTVGEDGPFAVSLVAPDRRAFTVMVGNAGLPRGYPIDRFVGEKLSAIGARNIAVGSAQPVPPRTGFAQALKFDVTYVGPQGNASRGVAVCNIAPAYDTEMIVMNGAFSVEEQWHGYSAWLPMVAAQIAATDGGAFGRAGVMTQNLALSKEFGEASRAYREHSERTWAEVSRDRAASDDRRNKDRRENLGSTRPYVNPYDPATPVDLPQGYKYYWVNRKGTYAGTNDPGMNPNDGSTEEWKQMPLERR